MVVNAVVAVQTILTARVLSLDGRGELTLAILVTAWMTTGGSFGYGGAAAYFTARADRPRPVVLGNSIVFALVIGAFLVAAGYGVVLLGHVTVPGLPATDLLLAILIVPFLLVLLFIQSVLLGLEDFWEFNVLTIGQGVVPLVAIVIALFAFKGGVHAAIIATLIATIAVSAWAFTIAWRKIGIVWRIQRSYLKAATSYGLRVYASNVLGLLGYRADVFILSAFKSDAQVALYGVAVMAVERLWMPSQAVGLAVFPRIAEERDDDVRRSITPVLARNTLWLTALCGGALYLLGDLAVSILFGSRYHAAVRALNVLIPGVILYAGARVMSNDIAARGRPGINSTLSGISVVINIGLNLVLIPRYGFTGAAWASTISYSAFFFLMLALFCRVARVPVRAATIPTRSDMYGYRRSLGRLIASLKAHRARAEDEPAPDDEPLSDSTER